MRRLLILALVMATALPAMAQTSFYTDRALQQVNVLTSPTPLTAAIPYGPVRVCSLPLTQQSPCLPLATITDVNGNPISNSIGGSFGQLTTDATGRFTFGCTLGNNYQVQVTQSASNTPAVNYPITCPGVGANPQFGSLTLSGPGVTTFNAGITSTGPNTLNGTTSANSLTNNGTATFTGTLTASNSNHFVTLDGTTYPFTDVGLLAAIAAAGSPGTVIIPPVTVSLANPITTLTDNQHIQCANMNSTKLNYTGVANITAIFDIGTPGQTAIQHNGISINNCTISGNSHVQYAIRTTAIHRSDFSHNNLINVTTAGFNSNFAVILQLDDLHTSVSEQAFTQQPASCMILDGPDASHKTTGTSVEQAKCEGVSGTGIVLGNTSTVTVKGGTSEQNNKGITLSVGANEDVIDGVDLEFNTTSNIEDGGQQNVFRNLIGNGTYKVVAGANSSYWIGLLYDTFSNAGNFTYLDYFAFNNSGAGTFTDTGTNSVRHWVQKLSVGQQFGDEYGTCVFAAATTCAVTFSPTWINAPLVFIQPVNPGAVTFTISVPTTTGFTITASAANSLTVNWTAGLH